MSFRKGLFCTLVCAASLVYTAETAAVVIPDKPITLFDGQSLNGWTAFAKDGSTMEQIWSVRDGVIHCVGTSKGYLRTIAHYENYLLTVEWRFIKAGNTGVIVHANGEEKVWPDGIECQGAHEHQGDFYLRGGVVCDQPFTQGKAGIPAAAPGVENPVGEWNRYEVLCDGGTIVVSVNGKEINRITGCSSTSGWIGLQSEGAEMEVRKVTLQPLP